MFSFKESLAFVFFLSGIFSLADIFGDSKDSLISDAIIIGFSKCTFSFGVTLFASVHASKLNEVSDPPVIPENCPVPADADALVDADSEADVLAEADAEALVDADSAADVLAANSALGIFPEGTRTLTGKINKFKEENSLLTQNWVMDPKKKVKDILADLNVKDLKIKE